MGMCPCRRRDHRLPGGPWEAEVDKIQVLLGAEKLSSDLNS